MTANKIKAPALVKIHLPCNRYYLEQSHPLVTCLMQTLHTIYKQGNNSLMYSVSVLSLSFVLDLYLDLNLNQLVTDLDSNLFVLALDRLGLSLDSHLNLFRLRLEPL